MIPRLLLVLLTSAVAVTAQVHYHDHGQPWKQRARRGPDAEVPGWYYNLGISGIRIELIKDDPKAMLVRHVFARTPASKLIEPGDIITGVRRRRFKEEHQNGYGMRVFGAQGPVSEFAAALEHAMTKTGKGKLVLLIDRDGDEREVTLKIKDKRSYAQTYPARCKKSAEILAECLGYLLEHQQANGSFGNPAYGPFAALALLSTGKPKHVKAVKRAARQYARQTTANDRGGGLINWRYMAAAIVLSEYYLATREKWVLPELEEIYQFLKWSQYTSMRQINPRARKSHPDAVPKTERRAHGGWGHNPGFEGYGPISMITGQGALAFALMKTCGIEIDRRLHDHAYEFLARGTGKNGYLWYADEAAGMHNWADMGRTGASGIANWLSPWKGKHYRERALAHARCIGEHPESFPDTHGSPILGMGYAALAASVDKKSFRKLMDANRWWFVLSRCPDGTFYYQPNRDNAGYGADSRLSATAVTAFIYSIPNRGLHITGKPLRENKRR
ncbi:MAG: hypothetical protein CMJ83_17310 [Planctomycetes bacterium]|nr:hypothetical protein [Planctomycetota bacterium]